PAATLTERRPARSASPSGEPVHGLPADADLGAGEPAAAAVAGVEPELAGAGLAGEDVGLAVAGEVPGADDGVHGLPAAAHLGAGEPAAAAVAGVEPELAGAGFAGEDVSLAVAGE